VCLCNILCAISILNIDPRIHVPTITSSGAKWSRWMHRPPWEHSCPVPYFGQASHIWGGCDQDGVGGQRPSTGVEHILHTRYTIQQILPTDMPMPYCSYLPLTQSHINVEFLSVAYTLLLTQYECVHWMPLQPLKEFSVFWNYNITLWSLVMILCWMKSFILLSIKAL
jgi:hypothetical protein